MSTSNARFKGVITAALLTLVPVLQACASPPSPSDVQQPSTRNNNRQIVSQAFDHWANGGGGFFNDILAEDAIWTIKGSGPSAGAYWGRDDFLERAVRPFAERMSVFVRPTVWQIWSDGDHVIANWDGTGVARDGSPYTNSYVWIMRIENGRAVEVTAFLDLTAYDDVLRRVPASSEEATGQ